MHIPRHVKSVVIRGKGRALIANRGFKKGEIILPLKGIIRKCSESTPDAVQLGRDRFIDSDHRYAEDHINHGCCPTMKIDFDRMSFVAINDIKKGEELTYSYLSTEHDLVKDGLDFDCGCGSKNCLKKIRGFKFLNKRQKLELEPLLSPFLKKKIKD